MNLIIDRTADGKLRAEVAGHPESAVEAMDVPGLLSAVRDALLPLMAAEPGACERDTREAVAADTASRLQDAEPTLTEEEDREMRRLAMDRMPDRETLARLVSRHPVPDHWPEGDEDWDDAP